MAQDTFDLVILGGGSGGYAAAFRAAELGLSVALVDRAELGGTCLHRGCIPTKALLHAAEIADGAKDSEKYGVKATFEGIDMVAVNKYKDGIISKLYKGLQGLAKANKVDFVAGSGRLTSPTQVTVELTAGGTRVLDGAHVLLATGSAPRTFGLPIDSETFFTSDEALKMTEVPKSVIVLGGGVIGCEFASVWRSFGAEVTIVEGLPHLVPLEQEASSKLLERAYRNRGIAFKLGSKFTTAEKTATGVKVTLESGDVVEAEKLLVAIGRGPVSEGLGYEEQGVKLDRGFVVVDEDLQTSVPTISAVGDLIPTLQLAHVGFAEGIFVAERIAGLDPRRIDYDGVPRITYSEPEVASVGITSATAKERGYDVVELTYDLAGNGKAQILGTKGAVTLVSQKDGPVLGIHMVGSRVGELMAEAQLIVNWEAYPNDVAQLIHPHPTLSEAVGEAHLALAGKPLHSHG